MLKKSHLAFVFSLLISSSYCSYSCAQQQKRTDNLMDSLKTLSQQSYGIEKLKIIKAIFDIQLQNSPKEAIQTANQMFLDMPHENQEARILLANVQARKHAQITNKKDSILYWSNLIIPHYKENKDSLSLLQAYQNLATGYYHISEYDTATLYYIKALQIAEKINSEDDLSMLYNNLAISYDLMSDVSQAHAYRRRSLELTQQQGNKIQEIKIYFNMSSSWINNNQADSAIYYAKKAVQLAETLDFRIGLYRSLNVLAKAYHLNDEQKKALTTIERALQTSVKDSNYDKVVLLNYSRILYANQKYNEAKANTHRLIDKIDKSEQVFSDKRVLQECYFFLSKSYVYLNEKDSAVFYTQKAKNLYEKMIIEKMTTESSKLQTQYETEKKEQQIVQLAQENKIKDLEVRNSYLIVIGSVVFASGLLLALWLFFRQRNLIQSLEKEKAQLRWRRAQVNPHFFFNVLSTLKTLIYERRTEEAHKHVSGFSVLMRQVLEGSDRERISLEEEIKFLSTYLELEKLSTDFDFEILIQPEDLEVEDVFIPPMLLQPFVENAIEHGLSKSEKADKKLELKFIEKRDDLLEISLRDNGVGRSEKRKKKHISMAIAITKERKKLMKDVFDFEIIDHKDSHQNPTGTEVTFTIKIEA